MKAMLGTLVVIVLLLMSGCVQPNPGPTDGEATAGAGGSFAPRAQDLEIARALQLDACQEAQSEFADAADNFEDALPPGFRLVLDPAGLARILTVLRVCRLDGQEARVWMVVVLVEPSVSHKRVGASHGVLLDLWADSAPAFGALRSWSVNTSQPRAMTVQQMQTPLGHEVRVRSDPDFLFTAHATGAHEIMGHASMRVFDLDRRSVRAAFDADRDKLSAGAGLATASFIVQPTGADLPAHWSGRGWVGDDRRDVVYELVPAGSEPGSART